MVPIPFRPMWRQGRARLAALLLAGAWSAAGPTQSATSWLRQWGATGPQTPGVGYAGVATRPLGAPSARWCRGRQQPSGAAWVRGARQRAAEHGSTGSRLPKPLAESRQRATLTRRCDGRGNVPTATRTTLRPPREWFDMRDSSVRFGAEAPLDAPLSGNADLGRAWLVGSPEQADEYDPVDHLIKAARPAGAEVRSLGITKDGRRMYELQLPQIELFGLGTARASVQMWGVVRSAGGPQNDQGAFLDIGSDGGPKAVIAIAGGHEVPLPRFDLQVRGAVGIEADGAGVSRAIGWISIEVSGEPPRIGFFTPPEEVLRAAAREVCAHTVGYATRRLVRDFSQDFATWHSNRARAAAALEGRK